MSAEEVCRIMLEEAGVAAIPGAAFGPPGEEFVRFSFASSNATLKEAVERILQVSSAWQGAPAAIVAGKLCQRLEGETPSDIRRIADATLVRSYFHGSGEFMSQRLGLDCSYSADCPWPLCPGASAAWA